ncbi:hypothetical protein [Xanthomonas sp. 1678]|uniref:hypothetical protein n=1 Tax=Xanthomonas sp. 1678 TaxID=3158788 RepID=UPI002855B066|nr:hypothetical protein [Xanthomonas translucens]
MNFAVFLMGENFLVAGCPELQGFFITKRIEAPGEEAAAAQAVSAIQAGPRWGLAASVAPTIAVKVVHPLDASIRMKDTDYLFFPMEGRMSGWCVCGRGPKNAFAPPPLRPATSLRR